MILTFSLKKIREKLHQKCQNLHRKTTSKKLHPPVADLAL